MVLRESFVVVSSQTKGPQGERCLSLHEMSRKWKCLRGRQESRQRPSPSSGKSSKLRFSASRVHILLSFQRPQSIRSFFSRANHHFITLALQSGVLSDKEPVLVSGFPTENKLCSCIRKTCFTPHHLLSMTSPSHRPPLQ